MAPFRLLHLDHVVLRVRDRQAVQRFYCDVLGCTVDKVQQDLGLWQLRAGSSLIDLVTLDGKLGREGGAGPGVEGRNLDHFCLRVEPFDAEAIRSHLRAHGIAAASRPRATAPTARARRSTWPIPKATWSS